MAMVLLTPLLAYGANLGFSPLMALAGLLGVGVIPPSRRWSAGMALLGALLLWLLATETWGYYQPDVSNLTKGRSVQALTGLKLIFELALYGAAASAMIGLRRDAAWRGMNWLAIGLGLLTVVLLLELFGGTSVYLALKHALHQQTRADLAHRNIGRAYYVLALLIWPVMLHAWRMGDMWRWLAGGLFLATLIGAVLFRIDAVIIAMVLAGVAFAAVAFIGRTASLLATLAVVSYFVLTPMLVGGGAVKLAEGSAQGVAKASWGARLEIWRFVAQLVERRPFFGWGLDASRGFPGIIPLHPHNAALQLWFELGAVGVGLVGTFFAWLFSRIELLRERDRASAAAAAATTVSYLVIGALSFGVWQEWWLGLGALSVVVCMAQRIARATPTVRTHSMSDLLPLITLA
jgi:hypothetical protein